MSTEDQMLQDFLGKDFKVDLKKSELNRKIRKKIHEYNIVNEFLLVETNQMSLIDFIGRFKLFLTLYPRHLNLKFFDILHWTEEQVCAQYEQQNIKDFLFCGECKDKCTKDTLRNNTRVFSQLEYLYLH